MMKTLQRKIKNHQKMMGVFKDFSKSFANYHEDEQKKSEEGLNDVYPFTYYDFLRSQKICVLYNFFRAMRYDTLMEIPDYSYNNFFIESNWEELSMIEEILCTTSIALRKYEETKNGKNGKLEK